MAAERRHPLTELHLDGQVSTALPLREKVLLKRIDAPCACSTPCSGVARCFSVHLVTRPPGDYDYWQRYRHVRKEADYDRIENGVVVRNLDFGVQEQREEVKQKEDKAGDEADLPHGLLFVGEEPGEKEEVDERHNDGGEDLTCAAAAGARHTTKQTCSQSMLSVPSAQGAARRQ